MKPASLDVQGRRAMINLEAIRIEIALLPDNVRVALQLDGLAERERLGRRAQSSVTAQ